jgi:hypothetical protein
LGGTFFLFLVFGCPNIVSTLFYEGLRKVLTQA